MKTLEIKNSKINTSNISTIAPKDGTIVLDLINSEMYIRNLFIRDIENLTNYAVLSSNNSKLYVESSEGDYRASPQWTKSFSSSMNYGNGMSCNITATEIPDVIFIACGYKHSIAIKEDGTLWGTGSNNHNQLGLDHDISKVSSFTQIGYDTDWKFVACGYEHSIAIKGDGTLWGAGTNESGRLGLGGLITETETFTRIGDDNDWKYVSCGHSHSVTIKEDNSVWGTGSDWYGQLGFEWGGDVRVVFVPLNIVPSIICKCGDNHTFTLSEDKKVYGTGSNTSGQIGLGHNNPVENFTEVTDVGTCNYIECGSQYTMIIKEDGTLWGTGSNGSGQLGIDNTTDEIENFTSVVVSSGSNDNWKSVSCGGHHTISTKEDNSVYGTGSSSYGQLGFGNNSYDTFHEGSENNKDILVSCGDDHSFLLLHDKSVWSTGRNIDGQLGQGNYLDVSYFTEISD